MVRADRSRGRAGSRGGSRERVGQQVDLARIGVARDEDQLAAAGLGEGVDSLADRGGVGCGPLGDRCGGGAKPGLVMAEIRICLGRCVIAQCEVGQCHGARCVVASGLTPGRGQFLRPTPELVGGSPAQYPAVPRLAARWNAASAMPPKISVGRPFSGFGPISLVGLLDPTPGSAQIRSSSSSIASSRRRRVAKSTPDTA